MSSAFDDVTIKNALSEGGEGGGGASEEAS